MSTFKQCYFSYLITSINVTKPPICIIKITKNKIKCTNYLANALSCKNKTLHLQRYPNHNLFTLRANTYRKHQATRCETRSLFLFYIVIIEIYQSIVKKYTSYTFFLQ